jgi:hypothetical protein
MLFKRNQIEEAISRMLEPGSLEPTSELRTRLKRLLETDRGLGRDPSSAESKNAHYAFYSAEAPGRGAEVWFSEYEAFALLNGLLLMKHGWPQSFAVAVLRRVRCELEEQHKRILAQDPKVLFDQEAIRRNARAGDAVFDNTDPVLLTIITKSGATSHEQDEPYACAICRGMGEAANFGAASGGSVNARTTFDVVGMAHRLSQALSRTKPRRRGRGTIEAE